MIENIKKATRKEWDVSIALNQFFQHIIGGEAMAPEAKNLWDSANWFWKNINN